MGFVLVLAIGLTIVEVWGLVRWFGLAIGLMFALAFAFLFGVVLVEELGRFRGIKGRFPTGTELTLLVIGVLVETIGWAVAFTLRENVASTFLALFVVLDLEHAIIATATHFTPPFTFADLVYHVGRVTDFTAVEAAGGAIWLYAPNAGTLVLMIITSVLEHVQGIRQALGIR